MNKNQTMAVVSIFLLGLATPALALGSSPTNAASTTCGASNRHIISDQAVENLILTASETIALACALNVAEEREFNIFIHNSGMPIIHAPSHLILEEARDHPDRPQDAPVVVALDVYAATNAIGDVVDGDTVGLRVVSPQGTIWETTGVADTEGSIDDDIANIYFEVVPYYAGGEYRLVTPGFAIRFQLDAPNVQDAPSFCGTLASLGLCGGDPPGGDPCDVNDDVPGTCGNPVHECDVLGEVPGFCGNPQATLCDIIDTIPGTCGNPVDECVVAGGVPGLCENPPPTLCSIINIIPGTCGNPPFDECDHLQDVPGVCGAPIDECDVLGEVPGFCENPPFPLDECAVYDEAPGTCGNPLDECGIYDEVPGRCGNPLDECTIYDEAPGTCGNRIDLCELDVEIPTTCGNPEPDPCTMEEIDIDCNGGSDLCEENQDICDLLQARASHGNPCAEYDGGRYIDPQGAEKKPTGVDVDKHQGYLVIGSVGLWTTFDWTGCRDGHLHGGRGTATTQAAFETQVRLTAGQPVDLRFGLHYNGLNCDSSRGRDDQDYSGRWWNPYDSCTGGEHMLTNTPMVFTSVADFSESDVASFNRVDDVRINSNYVQKRSCTTWPGYSISASQLIAALAEDIHWSVDILLEIADLYVEKNACTANWYQYKGPDKDDPEMMGWMAKPGKKGTTTTGSVRQLYGEFDVDISRTTGDLYQNFVVLMHTVGGGVSNGDPYGTHSTAESTLYGGALTFENRVFPAKVGT